MPDTPFKGDSIEVSNFNVPGLKSGAIVEEESTQHSHSSKKEAVGVQEPLLGARDAKESRGFSVELRPLRHAPSRR